MSKRRAINRSTTWGITGILQGCAVFAWLALLPSDGGILLGYSVSRLLMMLVPIVYILASIPLINAPGKRLEPYYQRLKNLFTRFYQLHISRSLVYMLLTGLLWLCLTPMIRFGELRFYFVRTRPLFVLAGLFLVTTLIADLIQQEKKISFNISTRPIIISIAILGLFILTRLIGLGWQADIGYWNTPGIPFTLGDIFITILIYFFLTILDQCSFLTLQYRKFEKRDIFIATALVLFLAMLWLLQPAHGNTFMSYPILPANDTLPVSDAQVYDLDALNLVENGRLGVGGIADKPFYSLFIALLHTLLPNGSYQQIGSLQIIFFSLVGALLYFLGANLSNRMTGILLALLGGLYGKNLLITAWIVQSANPRILSSGFPSFIMLVILALLFLKLHQERDRLFWYILYGGVLGLSTFVRYNFWILVPLSLIALLIINKGKRIPAALICAGAILVVILPWQVRSGIVTGNPTYFVDRFVNVIWEGRFGNQTLELLRPADGSIIEKRTLNFAWSALMNVEEYTLTIETADGDLVEKLEIQASAYCRGAYCVYRYTPGNGEFSWQVSADDKLGSSFSAEPFSFTLNNKTTVDPAFVPTAAQLLHADPTEQITPSFPPLLNHTLHNLITPLFTLPTSLLNYDHLQLMYKNDSIWWNSLQQITPIQWLLLAVNLFICSVGFTSMQKKQAASGWLMLGFYAAYSLGLGIARTSGGRYIVPHTAVLLTFYAAGLAHLLSGLPEHHITVEPPSIPIPEPRPGSSDKFINIASAVLVLLFGFSLILFESKKENLPLPQIALQEFADVLDLSEDELQLLKAMKEKQLVVYRTGTLYYPIQLDKNAGIFCVHPFCQVKSYPQLYFRLLTDTEKHASILRISDTSGFHNRMSVGYLACQTENYDEIIALVVFDENAAIEKIIPTETAFNELNCLDYLPQKP